MYSLIANVSHCYQAHSWYRMLADERIAKSHQRSANTLIREALLVYNYCEIDKRKGGQAK